MVETMINYNIGKQIFQNLKGHESLFVKVIQHRTVSSEINSRRKQQNNRTAVFTLALFLLLLVSGSGIFASYGAERPAYRRSATYTSDAWVINFWNTESDHMEEELAQIAADGFNSIILVVPWREFQPGTAPILYNDYAFDKLDRVMQAADRHGLWVELRVSYTWDYYEEAESRLRFRELLGNDQLERAWLDYMGHMYQYASRHPNFYGGFITWEDFWNYMEDAPSFGTGSRSMDEAKRIGFQDYLKERYSLEELGQYYGKHFTSYENVHIPARSTPAYKLLYEFYDDYLIHLLEKAQKVFPGLSMEVRNDVDTVEALSGGQTGAAHYQTFPCGNAPDTSLMYSVSMGFGFHQELTAASAVDMMNQQLAMVQAYNGGKPIYIDQLLYMDETEGFAHNARLAPGERGVFLASISGVLRRYTNGYGIWSYRNYANNPLYNSQFALKTRGWDTSRARVVERDGSQQVRLENSGRISQQFGDRMTRTDTNDNHVRFTVDSDGDAVVTVTLGRIVREVEVHGKQEVDLNFGKISAYNFVSFTSSGVVYLDNIQVYNFVQDGQLYGLDGEELGCLDAMRRLNSMMD